MADIEPRWLDAEAASRYLSMRVDAFLRAVTKKRVPQPSRHLGDRTPRWDRDVLDAMMIGEAATDSIRSAVSAVAEEIRTQGRKGRSARAA